MTTEIIAAPGAAAEITAPDLSRENPEVAKPDGEQPQEDRAEPKPLTPEERLEKERANFQRRINRQHSRSAQDIEAARYEARQLREELERLRPKDPEGEPQKAPTPEEIDRIANQRAREIASVERANERANAIFAAGVKAYGGAEAFREFVETVQDEAGPLYQRNGMPTALGEAIADSDNAHALLRHLGQNPELAEGLRDLSPAQLGRRIARIEADMKPAEPKPSNAPKPPNRPNGGGGTGEVSPESDAFMAHKLKQLRGR